MGDDIAIGDGVTPSELEEDRIKSTTGLMTGSSPGSGHSGVRLSSEVVVLSCTLGRLALFCEELLF